MISLEYKLSITEKHELQIYEWLPDKEIKQLGVVQISHGMSEHGKRYKTFADFMCRNGYAVYANDHRGHGKTAGNEEKLGHFADEDGWQKAVDDLKSVTKHIKEKHPDSPLFLLGHSMGSFLVRSYVNKPPVKLNGLIISGTATHPGFLGHVGVLIAKLFMLFKEKRSKSKFMDNMAFGGANKKIKPKRTQVDWLSRDNDEVDKYIDDPMCGAVPSIKFFYDLATLTMHVNSKECFENTAEDLAIYMFSGDADPIGNYGKGVVKVYNAYKKAGIKNITMKLYSGGRHEMLNEINREEVFGNILRFVSNERY